MHEIAPRYLVDLRLEVAIAGKKTLARSHDISLHGIGAYIPCDLDIGQYVDIVVRIPFKHDDLSFGAIVRNRRGYRYGLEFSKLRRPHEEFLEEFCSTLSNLSSFEPVSAFES